MSNHDRDQAEHLRIVTEGAETRKPVYVRGHDLILFALESFHGAAILPPTELMPSRVEDKLINTTPAYNDIPKETTDVFSEAVAARVIQTSVIDLTQQRDLVIRALDEMPQVLPEEIYDPKAA